VFYVNILLQRYGCAACWACLCSTYELQQQQQQQQLCYGCSHGAVLAFQGSAHRGLQAYVTRQRRDACARGNAQRLLRCCVNHGVKWTAAPGRSLAGSKKKLPAGTERGAGRPPMQRRDVYVAWWISGVDVTRAVVLATVRRTIRADCGIVYNSD